VRLTEDERAAVWATLPPVAPPPLTDEDRWTDGEREARARHRVSQALCRFGAAPPAEVWRYVEGLRC
jgi:hypothetical protein